MKTAIAVLAALVMFYGLTIFYIVEIGAWVGQFSWQEIGATVSIGAMVLYLFVSTGAIAVRTYWVMRKEIKRDK